ELCLGEQLRDCIQEVRDLVSRGGGLSGIAGVGHFGGSNQHLIVPREHEKGTAIAGFGVESRTGRAGKSRQNDVRTAYTSQHGLGHAHRRSLADAVGPRSAAVDDPTGVYATIAPGEVVAEQSSAD